jgi:KipI family sensor histidine kinase inhibitor
VRVLGAGPGALLVEVGSVDQALALYAEARGADLAVTDLVPAARTVLFDGVDDVDRLRRWLATVQPARPRPDLPAREVEVPTVYDGADLADVAELWGMTREEVVTTHTSTEHVVAFCGFAPGFAYCTGLPPRLAVPRLDTPRPKVPAGSVGLAGGFTGVYPTASPGGWRLVGRTSLTLWDPTAEEPALLLPGSRVRFVAVAG